jgi:hypothetical protein
MHIRKLLALVLLGLSLTATAQFTTITEAYEVAVSDLRMPRNTGGTLTFKQCADCDAQTLLVNSGTRYVLNDRDVELAEFKERLAGVRNATATVMHHLESNTITAVMIRL